MINNFTASRSPCRVMPGNLSCSGPQIPPPEDVTSLLSLQEILHPIFTIVEFSVLCFAFLGNLLIVLTILSNKKMHSLVHMFLLNVAIADFLFSVLNIAGHAREHLLPEKALKETFCISYRPIMAVRFVAYAVSMFCLTALSVERCYMICSPLRAQFASAAVVKKLKVSVMLLIWIMALAISGPLGLCQVTVTKTFAIFLALAMHVVPLVIITLVNVKMIVALKRNAISEISAMNEDTRGRVQKLLITLILSVVIFWSPYHCLFLYFVFTGAPSSPVMAIKLTIANRVGNFVAYFNPLLNALIYYIFSKEFRAGLSTLLGRFGCKPGISIKTSRPSRQVISRYRSRKDEPHFTSTTLNEINFQHEYTTKSTTTLEGITTQF